jgi:hypothetical protein
MYFIPNVGDEVLVAFEHGDINVPYVIGSLWHGLAPPPLPSPLPQVRMIRTLAGNTITFTEVPPGISILTPTGNGVVLGPPIGVLIESTAGAVIQVGEAIISVNPAAVAITAKNITVTATTQLNLAAPNVNVVGTESVNILAPMVKINSP